MLPYKPPNLIMGNFGVGKISRVYQPTHFHGGPFRPLTGRPMPPTAFKEPWKSIWKDGPSRAKDLKRDSMWVMLMALKGWGCWTENWWETSQKKIIHGLRGVFSIINLPSILGFYHYFWKHPWGVEVGWCWLGWVLGGRCGGWLIWWLSGLVVLLPGLGWTTQNNGGVIMSPNSRRENTILQWHTWVHNVISLFISECSC